MFIEKLILCQRTLDFSNPRSQFLLKESKRRQLVDISEYLSSNTNVINARTAPHFIEMVRRNLDRALTHNAPPDPIIESEDDEPFYEPAWPHLQLVYAMFLNFITSPDTDHPSVRAAFSAHFVKSIVDLFNSEDPREREYLKTILHRMYGKIMPLRNLIRDSIIDSFHRVVYDHERNLGLCGLLEILGSIIHGFAVPLKDEHKDLLRSAILPLHIPPSMPTYHVQLSFCVAQFVEKEPTMGVDVISTLLRHWPVRNSKKEVLLLAEIEEVLEVAGEDEVEDIILPLFRRIGKSIESPHFQVAERALFYWNNDLVLDIFDRYRDILMPSIVGALMRNTAGHWNNNVLLLSDNVLQSLKAMDTSLFEQSERHYRMQLAAQSQVLRERSVRWSAVYRMARLRSKGKGILADRLLDGAGCGHGVTAFGSDDSYDDDEAGVSDDDCDGMLKRKVQLNACVDDRRVKHIELIGGRQHVHDGTYWLVFFPSLLFS